MALKNKIIDLTGAPMCAEAIQAVDDLSSFIGAEITVHKLDFVQYHNAMYSSRLLVDVEIEGIRSSNNFTLYPSINNEQEINTHITLAFKLIETEIKKNNTRKVLFEKFCTI